METRQENNSGKRRRKLITRPILVRSAKPGGVLSADYTKNNQVIPLWKS